MTKAAAKLDEFLIYIANYFDQRSIVMKELRKKRAVAT